jgi:hypothetical protein
MLPDGLSIFRFANQATGKFNWPIRVKVAQDGSASVSQTVIVTSRERHLWTRATAVDSVDVTTKEDAMSCRLLTLALMASSVAFATESYAAKNLNTSRSNIDREGTPKGATGPAATPTGKSSTSNSSDRMGGGGGGKGATGLTSGRMGGGGGKGAVRQSHSRSRPAAAKGLP